MSQPKLKIPLKFRSQVEKFISSQFPSTICPFCEDMKLGTNDCRLCYQLTGTCADMPGGSCPCCSYTIDEIYSADMKFIESDQYFSVVRLLRIRHAKMFICMLKQASIEWVKET